MSRLGKLKAYARTLPQRPRMQDTALELFGEAALGRIEEILAVTSPDEKVREDLARSLCAYARDKAGQHSSGHSGEGSPAQIRKRKRAINKAARSLQSELAATDAATETVVFRLEVGGIDMMLLNNFIAKLAQIEIDSDDMRRADPEHWLLMDRVVDIFERTAQKPATLSDHRDGVGNRFGGLFFEMAEVVEAAAARAVQRPKLTPGALGHRLRRLLKYYRE
jgi:hypothetical protein